MECNFDIKENQPESKENIFNPFIKFKIIQLNHSNDCYSEDEIDSQIKLLLKEVNNLKNEAKKKLKKAKSRHDKLLSKR